MKRRVLDLGSNDPPPKPLTVPPAAMRVHFPPGTIPPRRFRYFESGYRWVGPFLAQSGVRFEEYDFKVEKWIYVDTLPDAEAATSYAKNCEGVLVTGEPVP